MERRSNPSYKHPIFLISIATAAKFSLTLTEQLINWPWNTLYEFPLFLPLTLWFKSDWQRLILIADVSASSWHHSQGIMNKLVQGFDFYTIKSRQISKITKDHEFFKRIPLRLWSVFVRLDLGHRFSLNWHQIVKRPKYCSWLLCLWNWETDNSNKSAMRSMPMMLIPYHDPMMWFCPSKRFCPPKTLVGAYRRPPLKDPVFLAKCWNFFQVLSVLLATFRLPLVWQIALNPNVFDSVLEEASLYLIMERLSVRWFLTEQMICPIPLWSMSDRTIPFPWYNETCTYKNSKVCMLALISGFRSFNRQGVFPTGWDVSPLQGTQAK